MTPIKIIAHNFPSQDDLLTGVDEGYLCVRPDKTVIGTDKLADWLGVDMEFMSELAHDPTGGLAFAVSHIIQCLWTRKLWLESSINISDVVERAGPCALIVRRRGGAGNVTYRIRVFACDEEVCAFMGATPTTPFTVWIVVLTGAAAKSTRPDIRILHITMCVPKVLQHSLMYVWAHKPSGPHLNCFLYYRGSFTCMVCGRNVYNEDTQNHIQAHLYPERAPVWPFLRIVNRVVDVCLGSVPEAQLHYYKWALAPCFPEPPTFEGGLPRLIETLVRRSDQIAHDGKEVINDMKNLGLGVDNDDITMSLYETIDRVVEELTPYCTAPDNLRTLNEYRAFWEDYFPSRVYTVEEVERYKDAINNVQH